MMKSIQDNIYHLIKNIDSKSNIDIFIIGKGPSIDEFSNLNFSQGLVININDSEKIIAGDIGIFSANWVRHSLKESGFNCKYYLAGKPLPDNINHSLLKPIPIEYDSEELLLFRFTQEDFFDESFVLSNALKVCKLIAELSNKSVNVYLLGFDFSTEKGEVSKLLGTDFGKSKEIDRGLIVHSQEYDFLQLEKYFQEIENVKLIHVGNKDFSSINVNEFKARFTSRIFIQDENKIDLQFTNTNKVLIVAELTNNHLGDVKRLIEMVERAAEAGADLIKIQKRDVESFYSTEKLDSYYWSPFGKTLRDYRKGVELDEGKLKILDDRCKSLGIEWFCSVLDFPSFQVIKNFNTKLIKIPSTISNHKDFHIQIANEYRGPIVISTGYTDKSYEQYVLDTFKNNELIYLLHCISAYPTALHDCNIAVVKHYSELSKKNPRILPGYSSHDIGSFASTLAIASGAKMLEKHVKLGDVDWVHFDKVALDLKTDSFKNYVKDVRQAELVLGSPIKQVLSSEHHKYEVAIKKTSYGK